MRIPIGRALGILLIVAIVAATFADLALLAAGHLKPWLGWMLP